MKKEFNLSEKIELEKCIYPPTLTVEAVKEFIKKLKEEMLTFCVNDYARKKIIEDIDNLAGKELIENHSSQTKGNYKSCNPEDKEPSPLGGSDNPKETPDVCENCGFPEGSHPIRYSDSRECKKFKKKEDDK